MADTHFSMMINIFAIVCLGLISKVEAQASQMGVEFQVQFPYMPEGQPILMMYTTMTNKFDVYVTAAMWENPVFEKVALNRLQVTTYVVQRKYLTSRSGTTTSIVAKGRFQFGMTVFMAISLHSAASFLAIATSGWGLEYYVLVPKMGPWIVLMSLVEENEISVRFTEPMEQLESKFTDALLSTITLNSLRWKKDMLNRWQMSFSRLSPGTHYISSVTGVPFGIYVVGLTPEYQFFHSAGFFISDFSGLREKTTNRYNDGVDNDSDGFIDEERENVEDFTRPKSRYGPVCEYTCTYNKDGKDCAISELCSPACDPKVSSTCKHEMLIPSRSWGKQFVLPQTVKESCEQSVPFLTHQPITVIHTTATEQTQKCKGSITRINDGLETDCDGFVNKERAIMKAWPLGILFLPWSQNKVLKIFLVLVLFSSTSTTTAAEVPPTDDQCERYKAEYPELFEQYTRPLREEIEKRQQENNCQQTCGPSEICLSRTTVVIGLSVYFTFIFCAGIYVAILLSRRNALLAELMSIEAEGDKHTPQPEHMSEDQAK